MTRPLSLSLLLLAGMAQAAPLQVSAASSIVADFVKNVGGSRVNVVTLVPAGADTHTFQPNAAAMRSLAGSKMLFVNGAGLEPWLPRLTAGIKVPVTELTAGLKLRPAPAGAGNGFDPHAWWDVDYAAQYVKTISRVLGQLDPASAATYNRNAAAYIAQMRAVDLQAKKQLATLPVNRRDIVTNHDALHYLAARYGLRVVGTVIPGLSTEREPSAREVALLVNRVKASKARVIFTENTVNARLAQTLARETGAKIAPPLFTDALAPKGSAGDTYLGALKYNTQTLFQALKK